MSSTVDRWKQRNRERVDVYFKTEDSGMLSIDLNLVGTIDKVLVATQNAELPSGWTAVSAAGAFNVLLIEPETVGNAATTDILVGYCSDTNATSTEVSYPRMAAGASDAVGLPVHGRYLITISDGATAGTEVVGVVRFYLDQ